VEAPRLQLLLREMLDIQLNDKHSSWEMQSDGSYVKLQTEPGEDVHSSFELLIRNAEKRLKTIHRMVMKTGKVKSKKK
jgi:polyphosphate kinase